jgi:hypothetical protein
MVIKGKITGSLTRTSSDLNAFVSNLRRIHGISHVKSNVAAMESDATGMTKIPFEVECELI